MVRLKDPEFADVGGGRSGDCPERFRYDRSRRILTRTIQLSSEAPVSSNIPVRIVGPQDRFSQAALAAAHDYAWLRGTEPPRESSTEEPVRCVDLFSGLGGMSLGLEEAARAVGRPFELVWAADIVDQARASLTAHHQPTRRAFRHPIERLLDGELGAPPTAREEALRAAIGRVDFLMGGPPCQGHSNLNNHTRRSDPKNQLYLKMVRAAEVLRPRHVIIENVPGVAKDSGRVMDLAREQLGEKRWYDYRVGAEVLRAEDLGVAQTRHRMFLVASRNPVLDLRHMVEIMRVPPRPVEWACHDLKVDPDVSFDTPSHAKEETRERINWLFREGEFNLPNTKRPLCHQKPHRYTSVYGRMWKNKPAGTITTGFLVMGQGRFVHPHEPRTLTPHEGARIQFLPDWLRLPSDLTRKHYATLVGNAVPPKLTYVLGLGLLLGEEV